ncbi:hypothetical protein TcCL_NonESM06803 [Trypanosoma cruzi]|nr:hypothetical protein TcCL_NonESM06803 [Trypanosoma cruzi]
MAGGVSAEKDLYLGSIYHSLEHLPQWYQVFALSGLFFLFPLREITLVGWLAVSLHRSFGTEIVWSEEYQRILEQMSFNERICLTLYGVALSVLAFFLTDCLPVAPFMLGCMSPASVGGVNGGLPPLCAYSLDAKPWQLSKRLWLEYFLTQHRWDASL